MGASIKNTRIIITGGANGLGNEYARQLLLQGAKTVAILDVDTATGNEAIRNFNSQFGHDRAVFFSTDVSKSDQFEASFKKAVKHLGGLDIMINNAGIMDDTRWNLTIDVNMKGVVQGTVMAIDVMGKYKGGKGGTIINVASLTSFMACQYIPVYCATKHAIIGFSRSVAMNFERTGVSVKTICPTATDTSLMKTKPQQYLEFVDQEKGLEWSRGWPLQKTEIVAEEVIRLIETAPNGAIWVNSLETSTMSLDIPEFTEFGTPV